MSNDTKIKEFRDAVETKRNELGKKPKLAYVTNALLDINGYKHNLNTLSNEEECVNVVRTLLIAKRFTAEANKALGTNVPARFGEFTVDQWIEDIKLRASLLTWEQEKKKLNAMDKQLAGLRSDDAKTSDAIANIAAQLAE